MNPEEIQADYYSPTYARGSMGFKKWDAIWDGPREIWQIIGYGLTISDKEKIAAYLVGRAREEAGNASA